MTYEHICDVLKVDLRQLGLDVGDEIEPCEPCHEKKKELKEEVPGVLFMFKTIMDTKNYNYTIIAPHQKR